MTVSPARRAGTATTMTRTIDEAVRARAERPPGLPGPEPAPPPMPTPPTPGPVPDPEPVPPPEPDPVPEPTI